MNSIEQEHINSIFVDNSKGKTMEDYFNYINSITLVDKDELMVKFKENFPDESNWSF